MNVNTRIDERKGYAIPFKQKPFTRYNLFWADLKSIFIYKYIHL